MALENDRGFELSKVVESCVSAQAVDMSTARMTAPFPLWTSVVELVGNMYYFEDQSPPPDGTRAKFTEIKNQLNGHARSDTLDLGNYERRRTVGLPNLFKMIGGFASELRFAREVFEADHEIAFRTEGGVDLIVDAEYRIEVTKKRPGGRNTGKRRRVSMGSMLESAVRHAYVSIKGKQERKPDVVGVDIAGRMPGFELNALQMLGSSSSLYDFAEGLESALEQSDDSLVVLIYAPVRSTEFDVSAVPQPMTSRMMKALDHLYERDRLI